MEIGAVHRRRPDTILLVASRTARELDNAGHRSGGSRSRRILEEPLGVGEDQVRSKTPSRLRLNHPSLKALEAHLAVHPEEIIVTSPQDEAVPGLDGHPQ